DEPAFLAKHSIDDVASVELSDGQEIEGGDKEPHPPRIGYGMYQDAESRGHIPHDHAFGELEQERIAEDTSHRGVQGDLYGNRQLHPDKNTGHRKNETAQGA